MMDLSEDRTNALVRLWRTVFTPTRAFATLKVALFAGISAMTFGLKVEANWTKTYLKIELSQIDLSFFIGVAVLICVLLVLDLWLWHRTARTAVQRSRALIELLQHPDVPLEVKLRIASQIY